MLNQQQSIPTTHASASSSFTSHGPLPANAAAAAHAFVDRPASTSASAPDADAARQDSNNQATLQAVASNAEESMQQGQGTVNQQNAHSFILTPSRLRVESHVMLGHATTQWLMNAIFCMLLLLKMDGHISCSWWLVFTPLFVSHGLHIPLQALLLVDVHNAVTRQLGPPPPLTASALLHMQYTRLRRLRTHAHLVDTTTTLLDSIAMLIIKVLFAWALEMDRLGDVSIRMLFTPFWVSFGLGMIISCVKKGERYVGSMRDVLFVFLLMVAYKADGCFSLSWSLMFVLPWCFFAGIFVLAIMVVAMLIYARAWSRVRELLLPIGFGCLLLSSTPHFVSMVALTRRLDAKDEAADGGDADAGSSASNVAILAPAAVGWGCMFLAGCVVAAGLRQKERLRQALLSSGAVWTMHEAVARQMQAQEREAAQQHVDQMSEEEISRLVDSMMAHRAKPGVLMRVGNTLYRRMTSLNVGGARAGDGSATVVPLLSEPSQQQAAAGRAAEPAPGEPGEPSAASAAAAGAAAEQQWHLVDEMGPGSSRASSGSSGHHHPYRHGINNTMNPGTPSAVQLSILSGRTAGSGGSSRRSSSGAASTAAAVAAPEPAHVSILIPPGLPTPTRISASGGERLSASGSSTQRQRQQQDATSNDVGVPGDIEQGQLPGQANGSCTLPKALQPLPEAAEGAEDEDAGEGGVSAVAAAARAASGGGAGAQQRQRSSSGNQASGTSSGSRAPAPAVHAPASTSSSTPAPAAAADAGSRGARTGRRSSGLASSRPQSALAQRISSSLQVAGASGLMGGLLADGLAGVAEAQGQQEDTCIICYDAPPTCVFLECGHGGFCKRCAYLLYVRPPGECPTCRQPIEQVVELEDVSEVGHMSRVKQ